MRNYLLLLLTSILSQSLHAQSFPVGGIEVYGNRKIKTEDVLSYIDTKKGDTVNFENYQRDKQVEKLKRIAGAKYVTVNPVCCDAAGKLTLYVGIGESDEVILKHRDSPVQHISLPEPIIQSYRQFTEQNEAGISKGQSTEDDSQGYALDNYPPAREEQQKFIQYANQDFFLLSKVLRESKYAEHRAAAAEIIAYSKNRKQAAKELLYAVDDADQDVRNNATRALGILAAYGQTHPNLKLNIPYEPFIRLLNSIVWTDRNKGALLLFELTAKRDPPLLKAIKEQALLSVIEMARWEDKTHSSTSFYILGRMEGIDEAALMKMSESADWGKEIDGMIRE
jgi:hypothetical protein